MQILDIRCLSSCFSLNAKESKNEELEVNVNSESKYDEKREIATITVILKAGGDDKAITIEVKYGGTFLLPVPGDEQSKERFLKAVLPGIVFPFLREHVADLTRRAGLEALQLPIIDFMDSIQSDKHK